MLFANMDVEAINVIVSFFRDPIKIKIDDNTTVEDIIIDVCKFLKISPVTRHLFALKYINVMPIAWLSLSHRIHQDKPKKDYEFAIRYNVPDVNRLKSVDLNTYDFYFKQAKQGILKNSIPNIDMDKYEKEINGLSVLDMLRATKEDGLSEEYVLEHYRKFLPVHAKQKHKFFLKKPVIQKFKKVRRDVDALYVKSGYLEQFKKIAPNYLTEEFNALILRNDIENLFAVQIRVNPFDENHPGISTKDEHEEKWEHICSIEDLCYLNIRNDGTVEISRKNGIPLYLKFSKMCEMKSFVTLLDGYYRLIMKWTFNLCKDLPTPSLQRLFPLRCHGPVSGEFAYRKLAEKRNNEPGSYILRESDLEYDSYYVDVCTKTSSTPKTYKLEKTNDGRFMLSCERKIYSTIFELINDHKSEPNEILLLQCVPPSEYDQSNLLLCQVSNDAYCKVKTASEDDILTTMPICIDARTLMVFKSMPRDGRSSCTTVYRSVWNCGNGIKRNIAIKILEKSYLQKNLTEFLSLTSRWAFVNANTVVKLYGVTLSNPVSMVMEYLPLGQLDLYLADSKNRGRIKEVNLVEASTYLANALYYLNEAKFIHGYIRCRKLLVAAHTDNSFVVKLADPGLCNPYNDFDLHWIPPEYHSNSNNARETIKADVWAFATTLWEIFSYGASPPDWGAHVIKKFYSNPKNHLPIPPGCPRMVYYLMLECWNSDPYARKSPQGIMRDINQIFYQVYNFRLTNQYAAILPSTDCEQDNVSNNSKTSNDMSSSFLSELTCNTLLDDSDDRSSMELSFKNINLGPDVTYQVTDACTQGYRCITDKNEMMALSSGHDYQGDAFSSISSMQSIFELDKEWNLILTGLMGEGFHGQVFRGRLDHIYEEREQQMVAVKKLKREAMMNVANQVELDKEISTMLKLEHPNIVKIIGRVQDPELCLVLEYIEHGSLKSYLNIHRERLSTHHLLKFALDVAKGMAYLCEMKYVHRDLAARNVLVVNEFLVKISDFGLARFIGNDNYYYYRKHDRDLPIKWYAPESIEQSKFSFQSDVWSYGVTLFEMFSFGAEPQLPIKKQTPEEICNALRNNIRLPMPLKCPQFIYANVMVPCWQYEANLRPTFIQLCKTIEELFNLQQN